MKGNDKPSKLREKPTRLPSIQLERKAESIRAYLAHVHKPDLSEYARGVAFANLLKDLLLEANPEFLQDYLAGMEHSLGGPKTALYNRGRIDALYGNLVIEFKRSLAKSLDDAKDQLRKYLAVLLSKPEERPRPLIGMATDGVQIVAFAPRFSTEASSLTPEDVSLVEIESANLDSMSPDEAYYWLDRYFTRQTGPIAPRTKQIVDDFGPTSGSFIHTMNVLSGVWKTVEKDSESQVFYDSWQKYLRITYGGPVAEAELFLRHTYLATLAKLMVWVRLTGATEPPDDKQLRTVLNGQYFSQRGIQNFLEEDFFAWVARDAAWPQALVMSRRLLVQLATYNLRELSEDVLKGLYERLVDPRDRHDLGEYYTPDWLAAKIVEQRLMDSPEASVLDPACGSGTFLYQTILFKRDKLSDSAKTLKHIEGNVVGVDIHPLAVIIAKTTYLLGLGDLLEKRTKAIRIPVYLADSIRPPDRYLAGYRAELDGDHVNLPEDLALSAELYDRSVELCSEYARSTADDPLPNEQGVCNFLRRNEPVLVQEAAWRDGLYQLFKVLREKIKNKKDTIWAFVLKNVFKPLLLKERFDVVVGNPPWLSYRYIERGAYQAFLKEEITEHYGLLVGRPELLTHMELGTLFFVRCADFYLRDGGRIGFVLPKSIFVADQHHAFRQGNHAARLRLSEVWDLEGVRPLFNVPASVAFAEKSPKETEWPLAGRSVTGQLEARNVPPDEAAEHLTEAKTQYWLSIKGTRSYFSEKKEKPIAEGSPYRERFADGAAIYPGSFYFVILDKSGGLGIDPKNPYLRTDPHSSEVAKEKYKEVVLQGNVEAEFLYLTLLARDLVPFGHLPFRTVVLPITWKADGYAILTAEQARKQGYIGLAEWMARVESLWEEKRGEKAGRASIYEWLDYRRKLTSQKRGRYTVVYPKSATYLCCGVVDGSSASEEIREGPQSRFLVDHVLYYADTDVPEEAYYLSAVLNSPTADHAIKPLQTRGDFGPRDIHKKIWELSIPSYDGGNADHKKLASLGADCNREVAKLLDSLPAKLREGSLGRLRNVVREAVAEQLKEIDETTRLILAGI